MDEEIGCGTHEDRRKNCSFASESAKQAVKETFAILGVDINNPAEVEEFRKSLRFGDTLRKATDRGLFALAVLIASMGAAALWTGVVAKIKSGGS